MNQNGWNVSTFRSYLVWMFQNHILLMQQLGKQMSTIFLTDEESLNDTHSCQRQSKWRQGYDTLLCSSTILQELCRMFATCCAFFVVWCQPISTILFRVVSLTLGQSYDCPSASETTLKDMGKYIIWIHKNWWYIHNKTKHNKNKYIFLSNILHIIFHTNHKTRTETYKCHHFDLILITGCIRSCHFDNF